jgi:starvation-inducible DNA-binding protein
MATVKKGNAIGINEANRKKVAADLNHLLADEMLLYTKTRKFHWNVIGPQFHDLHLFLEGQYDELALIVDEVAERVRKIGFFATGSMKQFLADSSLKENVTTGGIKIGMLQELIDDHDKIIRRLRELIDKFDKDYEDAGSSDFVTGLIEKHEKMAWMLRSTLA